MMKNLTVTVPDDVYRGARVRAAEVGTSVSALVADYLRTLAASTAEVARLERLQAQTMREIRRFSAADRLSRDEVHDRAVR